MNLKGSEVRVENAEKHFGDYHALKNVTLTIKRGEFFSLLGPSGCGKTTLLRIIAGFEEPTQGFVNLDEENVLLLPPNKRHVNTVFQNYALFPHLTVFENIAFSLRLKKVSKAIVKEKVFHYLQLVHLVGHENKKPHQISGGQKQRVAIARALINEPNVLLLDEPLSALDAKLRQQLLVDLDLIHDQIGITFIYVTHDQSEALSVSDRIAVMNEGRILQIGTPYEIYEKPVDIFVAQFIGETNIMTGLIVEREGDFYTIDTQNLGRIIVTSEKHQFQIGDRVHHTIRPEKISITKKKPVNLPVDFNVVHGKVFESIYSGFQSKFFVDLAENVQFKIYKQHENFLERGPEIQWEDEVYIFWDADDGFMVEKI